MCLYALLQIEFLPAATKLGQGNVFTGVCDSVHRGVSASVHAGIPSPGSRHPLEQTSPGADTHPPEQKPPPQADKQTSPMEADSGIRSTSGW